MTRSSVIVLLLSLAFAASILWTARRHRTTERHTFAWLLVAVAVAALAIWRPAIDAIAGAMGIHYAPSALFFATTGALVWLVYRQSLEISDQRRKINRVAQELAVLSAVVARVEAERSAESPQQENARTGT